ncbi:hypothetical protein BDY17DRAFT_195087 [Neohortaea acidophila]|uniref:Uncharacterized protein n=1 Tax=Neohortaea acidophila TaxID=245834 RepID=A0A6A6PKN2_9PEZI|nr:uncharacterized protein BDY17DRAFT_195087 [Neohortaea acidophila]KAF2480579.1 hypothetical protein BDY17DRAFT_195087 [Neohortaea acidophila]
MVRVRQTVYEDPGNPFQENSQSNSNEDRTLQTSNPEDEYYISTVSTKTPEDSDESDTEDGQGIMKTTRISQYSTPAAAKDPVADQGRSDGPRAFKPDYRRSQSVALPITRLWLDDENEEYVPPRALWRQQSVAAVGPVDGRYERGEDARDTKFYGFYDEVWRYYQMDENRM